MSTLLVPWICEAAAVFLNNGKRREEPRIVQVLSNVEGTTSSFVVHDSQHHIAASFTDRAIGRYIKSGHELKHLGRSVVNLEEWSFTVMNGKQVILVVDKVRHVMEGGKGMVTEYVMQDLTVQNALQRYLGRASLPMCVVEEEENFDNARSFPYGHNSHYGHNGNEFVGGETLEPGEWNYLETFYATQQTQRNVELEKEKIEEAEAKEEDNESDYEVPAEQWDLIVEQMVGAGLTTGSSPIKQGSPFKHSSPIKQGSPFKHSSPIKQGSPIKQSSPIRHSPVKQTGNSPFKHLDSPFKHSNSPLKHVNSPLKHVNSPFKHANSPFKHANSPLKQNILQQSTPQKASPFKPVLRFEPVCRLEEEDVLRLRPVYSSSSPVSTSSQSTPLISSQSSHISSSQSSHISSSQSSPLSSYQYPNYKGKSPESLSKERKKQQPRYEVNMTPRRVLFEGDDSQEGKIEALPSISLGGRKSGTPKRLRLYTDW